MKLVFLGPPGAGKGTQAQKIAAAMGLAHISTGEILRGEMRAGSELGLEAKACVEQGMLVADDLINRMVKARLAQPDAQEFLLDGYPRTVAQAQYLENVTTLDAVVNIDVPSEALAKRLSGRRTCAGCGLTTHVSALAPGAKCPRCSGELIQRPDDQEATVLQRLEVYAAQTAPLVQYYQAKGLLHTVDGSREIDAVTGDIEAVLRNLT